MSDVRELVKAIITGKDYNEIFNQVMANKASELIAQHKEVVAKSMFEYAENEGRWKERPDMNYTHIIPLKDNITKDHLKIKGMKHTITKTPMGYEVGVHGTFRKSRDAVISHLKKNHDMEEGKDYKIGFKYRPADDIKEAMKDDESVTQKKVDYTQEIIVDKTDKKRKVYANPTESTEADDEELNELKSSTLASYVKKASHDVAAKGALTRSWSELSGRQKAEDKWVDAKQSSEKADKIFNKSWKRRQSMAKAVDKLASRADESVDVENSDIDCND